MKLFTKTAYGDRPADGRMDRSTWQFIESFSMRLKTKFSDFIKKEMKLYELQNGEIRFPHHR